MPRWTEERRKAHSERMKALWAEGRYKDREMSPEGRERQVSAVRQMHAEGRGFVPPPMEGTDNPMYGKRLSDSQKERIGEVSRGRRWSDEDRKRMSEQRTGKPVHSQEFKDALAERNRERKGKFKHTEETKQKISESNIWKLRKGDFRYLGWAQTTKAGRVGFRSLYELRAIELLEADSSVTRFEYEKLAVSYSLNGTTRRTVPDFRVWGDRDRVIEVKPRGFTYHWKEKLKMGAARRYCEEHGLEYVVWDESFLWPASCPRETWECSLPTTFRSQGTSASS